MSRYFRAPPNSRIEPVLVLAIVANAVLLLALAVWQGQPWLGLGLAAAMAAVGLYCGAHAVERWFTAPGVTVSMLALVITQWAMAGVAPALWLNALLTLSVLPSTRRPAMVALAGTVLALAPAVLEAAGLAARPLVAADLLGYGAFVALQTALLTMIARRNSQRARERFDIEFLVRAMGSEGSIRLGLDAVRAESALGERLKQVQHRMADALRQVRSATVGVRDASLELDASSEELSGRTERSAAGLRDAAMTLEQITVIVQSSAKAAQEARAMAAAASVQAQQGGELFNRVTASMQEIDAAARRITEVIGVIDGIAFQTNILALNAAVEAARAGEQGRGFAVVAAEVRNLALRASEASAEVRQLINASTTTVRGGTALVDEAGRTMSALVESVRKVGLVFESLSDDTHEHAGSIEVVTQSVTELDEMTRRNATVVETTRRVARSLLDQGAQLEQVLGSFKLGAAQAVAVLPAAPQPPAVAAVASPPSARAPAARPVAAAAPRKSPAPVAAAAAPAGDAATVTFF